MILLSESNAFLTTLFTFQKGSNRSCVSWNQPSSCKCIFFQFFTISFTIESDEGGCSHKSVISSLITRTVNSSEAETEQRKAVKYFDHMVCTFNTREIRWCGVLETSCLCNFSNPKRDSTPLSHHECCTSCIFPHTHVHVQQYLYALFMTNGLSQQGVIKWRGVVCLRAVVVLLVCFPLSRG